ncbi:MAG: hypothetical protein ACQEQU_07730 [Spirochaetota bacterium]
MGDRQQPICACGFWCMLIGITIFLVSGCEQHPEMGELHMNIEPQGFSSTRSALPDTPLEISYYEIEGRGPEATGFELSTEDSQVTVPGLLLGDWDVTVIGYSSEGVGLGYGQSVITLTNTQQNGTLFVEQFYGTGSADIMVQWDDQQTIDADLRLSYWPSGYPEEAEELTADTAAAGSHTYLLEGVEAGAYLLQAELYSEGTLTAGATEMLRVVDGMTTQAQLTMTFNDLLVSMQLTLEDSMDKPVSGEITGVPLNAEAGVPVTVQFTPDADSVQTGLTCHWFLNGQDYAEGNPITFTPTEGKQRLDVLVFTSSVGSEGSSSQIVEGITDITSGQPLLYRSYDEFNDLGLLLDGITDMTVLPDGIIVTVSQYDDAVQFLKVEQDRVQLVESFEHGASILLDGAYAVSASADGSLIAVASANSEAVTLFEHVAGTETFTHSQSILSTGTGTSGSYTIEQFGDVALSSNGEVLVVSDTGSNTFVAFDLGTEAMDYRSTYDFTHDPQVSDPRSIDFGLGDNLMGIASYDTNALIAIADMTSESPKVWNSFSYDKEGTYGLSGIHTAQFVTDQWLVTLANDSVCDFLTEDYGYGLYDITYNSRLKEDTHIPVSFRPKAVTANTEGTQLYVATSTGDGFVILERDPATQELEYSSFVAAENTSLDSILVTEDQQYLLTSSSTQDRLLLYKFAP